ncbi:hypothetical protein ANCDUO_23389, partial [Ancylostoma duodenale]
AVWWSVKGQKFAFLSREKTKEKSVYLTSPESSFASKHWFAVIPETTSTRSVVELPYPKTHEERLPTYVVNIWDKETRKLKRMDVQLRDNTYGDSLHRIPLPVWSEVDSDERRRTACCDVGKQTSDAHFGDHL